MAAFEAIYDRHATVA
jgi:RNA polymerase sigma-70 factor (ECF subfamily)